MTYSSTAFSECQGHMRMKFHLSVLLNLFNVQFPYHLLVFGQDCILTSNELPPVSYVKWSLCIVWGLSLIRPLYTGGLSCERRYSLMWPRPVPECDEWNILIQGWQSMSTPWPNAHLSVCLWGTRYFADGLVYKRSQHTLPCLTMPHCNWTLLILWSMPAQQQQQQQPHSFPLPCQALRDVQVSGHSVCNADTLRAGCQRRSCFCSVSCYCKLVIIPQHWTYIYHSKPVALSRL